MTKSSSISDSVFLWWLKVPKNLRRILFPEWAFNRKVKTKKSGYVYVAVICAVAMAAFNTGNNLLYLVLGMMLSALLFSFMMSEYVLQKLKVKRDNPETVMEGVSFRVTYNIKNNKKIAPSFAFSIHESLGDVHIETSLAYLSAGKDDFLKERAVVNKRGRIDFHHMNISTSAPFGWFRKYKKVPLEGEVISLPSTEAFETDIEKGLSEYEGKPRNRKGRGDDIFGFRKYQRGDPTKDIHWKTSAKTGNMMVRLREENEERKIRIVLDFKKGRLITDAEEKLIRKAAATAKETIERGWSVRMEISGKGVDFGAGSGHLHTILLFLALFDDPESKAGEVLIPTEVEAFIVG
jgi:uncharacterized protein (DUF58 family)